MTHKLDSWIWLRLIPEAVVCRNVEKMEEGEVGSREEITQEKGPWIFLYSLKIDCQTQELFEYTKVQKENPLLLVFKVSQDP